MCVNIIHCFIFILFFFWFECTRLLKTLKCVKQNDCTCSRRQELWQGFTINIIYVYKTQAVQSPVNHCGSDNKVRARSCKLQILSGPCKLHLMKTPGCAKHLGITSQSNFITPICPSLALYSEYQNGGTWALVAHVAFIIFTMHQGDFYIQR